MKWPRPMRRIGGRIFMPFAVLLVSVMTLFSLIGLNFADKTIRTSAANELRIVSVGLGKQLQSKLSRIGESLTSLENHGFLVQELRKTDPDKAAIEEFLQTRLTMQPLFEDLAVYNRLGVCIGATDPSWYDVQAKQQPFFVSGLRNFNFSDIFTANEDKVQLVSTPINNGTVVRGVLVGQVNMASIYDVMDQQLLFSQGTDAFLIDSALRFITPGKTGIDRLLESHLIATPLVKHLNDDFWVGQYRNYNGQEVLGTVLKLPRKKWYVVIERDLAEVTKPIHAATKLIALTFVILAALLTLFTYALTRSITRPLMTLVEGAQRVAKGDFRQPLTIPEGIEEVAFLASEFDKMRTKVAAFQESMTQRLEESERKRLENERLAAIGTLASTMAHEIRNPLNAMSLLLARLESTRSAPEARGKALRDIRGEIARLDHLVSDILDYARPLNLNLREDDLKPLIFSTLEFYKAMFDQKHLHIQIDLPDEPALMRMDRDRIKQCLVNLLQNSLEAVSPGGLIGIAVTKTTEWIQLVMYDDGVGLPPQPEGRLFDLFFTTKENGTGLGLSTVKKITDAHGGIISLSSRTPDPGSGETPKGTEVCLRFPHHSQI